jgi:putative phosphonate metabolism protein
VRYAVYFTPRQTDDLARIAAAWLGRDPFGATPPKRPEVPGLPAAEIASRTKDARRYGFHATLKAPFRLADDASEAELEEAVASLTERLNPLSLPLVAAELDGFLALVPAAPAPALDQLAAEAVRTFDRFRAPLGEAEIARRKPETLSRALRDNLHRWGYPYVFEAFQFHLTLTDRLPPEERTRFRAAIDAFFGAALEQPLPVDGLALFVEPEPGADFTVKSWHAFPGRRDRKVASR